MGGENSDRSGIAEIVSHGFGTMSSKEISCHLHSKWSMEDLSHFNSHRSKLRDFAAYQVTNMNTLKKVVLLSHDNEAIS